ncbi:hypothetical protein WH43_19170 [Rheinheimera sp. KL1]|uniref:restriction endonuclease subunit S n=1 Tax=Rheinheimera sp. KL1 TaxID=1635005 RepID=UPI0006A9B96F|nr:restriction endonuclease subunit S [Rheinheimera sp. KL1]KOO56648.1 hypothetical protein WH43_19170 [Rheinheimera sp. KL1]
MSFEYSNLDAVAEIIDSLHKTPVYSEVGQPMVRVTDVKYGVLNLASTFKVDSEVFDEFSRRYKPKRNDIVITRVGSFGITALVKDTNFCLGQNTAAIVPKSINPRYLYAALNSPFLREQIEASAVGSTQKTLSLKCIKLLKIPRLGPQSEDAVAELIGSLDDRIALLRETNATLEAIAQALFKSWFVDFDPVYVNAGTQAPILPPEIQALFPATFTDSPQGPIPEGWKLVPFGDLLTHTIGGDWGDELPTEKNEVRVAIIRGTDLPDLAAGNAERVPIRYTSAKKLASRKLQDGDLVLEVSGGSKDQPTGRSLYLTNGILSQFDCPMEPASFCRLLRPESQNISVVLAQHMTYIYAQGKTWEYQNQSTGISNFQTTHFLESERVVVPSDEVLKVFAENVRPMIDRAHLTQISKLTALRDTLLPRLISGQLRLPEAEQAVAAITD